MKLAKEKTTSSRETYIQATALRGMLGGYHRVDLRALRDLVAATEGYSENSEVRLDSTSVKVIETKTSHWKERGREMLE